MNPALALRACSALALPAATKTPPPPATIGGMTTAQAQTWWAFQPLTSPPSSHPSADLAALLGPASPAAEPRVLLRRLTYDLTGLPPSPAELAEFLADTSPQAYAKLVDRLLASPAYGEKWGRFWLDVVRYADTAGENTDRPLPHAWRYRNWVIDAFNRDLPYDAFVRQQLAGDLLAPLGPPEDAPGNIIATGFLALARRFGHDIDKDIHLTFEDAIDTTGKSFLGLSLGCARCHDHKYDPITARDYYALYGILQSSRFPFTGCEPKPQPKDLVPIPSPASQRATASWEQTLISLQAREQAAEAALLANATAFPASPSLLLAEGALTPGTSQEWTLGTAATPTTLALHKGELLQLSILPQANYGADSTGVDWIIAESGGAQRQWQAARDFLAALAAGGPGTMPAATWQLFDLVPSPRLLTEFIPNAENTPGLMVWRGPEPCPSLCLNPSDQTLKFLTVSLPPRSLALHPGPNGGVALGWECPEDLTVTLHANFHEIDPGGDGIAWKIERRPSLRPALAAQPALLRQLAAARQARQAHAAQAPPTELAFALADAAPSNAALHKKGEPTDPGEEVPRRLPTIFGGTLIPPDAGSGRRQLADALTSGPARHLAARVIANRLWAGHFGVGIVATPNDFGSRGAPPTQPALLEFLAAQLIHANWSLKSLHRLILSTPRYQQQDFPRRRLTAEELRDTLLAVSGTLDPTPGGPHPFPPESSWTFTQHGPFKALYDNTQRSVYQMVQRTQRHPFLALFDGADPNASSPQRSQSTVPTQALYFLNDPFLHAQAQALATRLLAATDAPRARLDLATRLLYSRPPSPEEVALAPSFLTETAAALPQLSPPVRTLESWTAWLRVLLSSNEFLYVD